MAFVHFRVELQGPGVVQHPGDDQGGRERAARRHPDPAGLRQRHHAQPGHKGGKGCGMCMAPTAKLGNKKNLDF